MISSYLVEGWSELPWHALWVNIFDCHPQKFAFLKSLRLTVEVMFISSGKNTKLANKRILLLEQQKKIDWKPQEKYSNRVSALNQNTQSLLSIIDAWPHIANYRFGSVKRLQVWDALSEAMITFDNDDLLETVAYVVENDTLLGAVGKEVVKTNVQVVNEAKVKSYVLPRDSGSFTKVNLENGNNYTCKLLVSDFIFNTFLVAKCGTVDCRNFG